LIIPELETKIEKNIIEESKSTELLNLGILEENILTDGPEICEIDISVPEISDSTDIVQLKNRNEVYFNMYKDAKKKAKMARDIALTSYLEAKRIKNTYLLEQEMNSDEEEDDDIDSLFQFDLSQDQTEK
jgi:hypothetical protein